MKLKFISLILILVLLLAGCVATPDVDTSSSGDTSSQSTPTEDNTEAPGEVITITTENFGDEVLKSDKIVLVDFWAEWCPPCKALGPIVEEIARENPQIKVGKVDVDENPALASQFGAISIPLILVFKDGKVVNRHLGLTDKDTLLALLDVE